MAGVPDFAELLNDFTSGGIVVVDRFPDRDDEQVAFRTLLQLDGDVLFSIHADALARPDFAELLDEHQQHVRQVLDAKGQRLRLLATGFGFIFGAFGGVGASISLGGAVSYLQSISIEWVIMATGTVGSVLFWAARRALVDVWLRLLLRRWAFARVRPPSTKL